MRIYVCPTEKEGGRKGECDRVDISIVYSWATWATQQVEHGQPCPALSGPVRPHRNVAPGRAGQLGLIYIINFEYFIVCLGKDTAGGTASSSSS